MLRLAKCVTDDGLELDGLISHAEGLETKLCVVHVHGKCGNFYQNAFIQTMCDVYASFGIGFATFNNRGHDCVAEFYRNGDVDYVGGSLERLDDSVLDIAAAIREAKQVTGASSVLLQGHSLGCDKVVSFVEAAPEGIEKVILLSPADSNELQRRWLARAPGPIMPAATAKSDQRSLRLLLDAYGVAGSGGYPIPISKEALHHTWQSQVIGHFDGSRLPNLAQPMLVYVGGLDALQLASPSAWVRNSNPTGKTVITIDEGDHHFHGYEQYLARFVAGWTLGATYPYDKRSPVSVLS